MKRFPFIKQKDSMQCGVACLASICEYYGKKYSTQFISKLCSCTPTGISLQSLKLAAEQLGFDSMCVCSNTQRFYFGMQLTMYPPLESESFCCTI